VNDLNVTILGGDAFPFLSLQNIRSITFRMV
jgi:hypothetical protein